MTLEILEKKENECLYEPQLLYNQEKGMMKKEGIRRLIRTLFKEKGIKVAIQKTRPPKKRGEQIEYLGKYLIDVIWDRKKTANGNTFCKTFSIIPYAKEEKIVIAGLDNFEIEKERLGDKDFIKEKLLEAFENPIPRSNTPFYRDELKEK